MPRVLKASSYQGIQTIYDCYSLNRVVSSRLTGHRKSREKMSGAQKLSVPHQKTTPNYWSPRPLKTNCNGGGSGS